MVSKYRAICAYYNSVWSIYRAWICNHVCREGLRRHTSIAAASLLQGWERLTDAVVHWLNDHLEGVVFLLWGTYAQKKGSFIDKVGVTHCLFLEFYLWLFAEETLCAAVCTSLSTLGLSRFPRQQALLESKSVFSRQWKEAN